MSSPSMDSHKYRPDTDAQHRLKALEGSTAASDLREVVTEPIKPNPGPKPFEGGDHHVRLSVTSSNSSSQQAVTDQDNPFWERYHKVTEFEDREFVRSIGGSLDSLLNFAGLFSIVNALFIVESLKTIQPNQEMRTNDLLRSVILVLQNNTISHGDLYDMNEPSKPQAQRVRTTAIFFASLCYSLSTAFGVTIAKWWLNQSEPKNGVKSPGDRGRDWQKRYEARTRWGMENIIGTLPSILHISLALFVVALVDFLWPIDTRVGWVVIASSLLPILFYLVITIVAAISPIFPLQTPLAASIRLLCTTAHMLLLKALWSLRLLAIAGFREPVLTFLNITGLASCTRSMPPTLSKPFNLLWGVPLALLSRAWDSLSLRLSSPSDVQHNSTERWNLKCLLFYMRSASTSEDLNHVLTAINSIPSPVQLHPNDPVLNSLGVTLIAYAIKPKWNPKTEEHTSELSTTEFQYLLKPLRLLYSSWACLDHPDTYQSASPYFIKYWSVIHTRLWDVFAQNPYNISAVKLVADIVDAVGRHHEQETSDSNQELLMQCIQSQKLDVLRCMPYISLLASQPACLRLEDFARTRDGRKVVDALIATMWDNGRPDLNHGRGRLRALLVPDYLEGAGPSPRFTRYLLECCKKYLADKDSDVRAVWIAAYGACPTYLKAMHTLLHQHCKDLRDTQQLEDSGCSAILLRMFAPGDSGEVPALALMCFITLWYRRQAAHYTVTEADEFPPYLTRDSVSLVVEKFWLTTFLKRDDLDDVDAAHIALALEYAVDYFEEASRFGLLRRGMETLITDYKRVGDEHLQEDLELRKQLYERIDRLGFA